MSVTEKLRTDELQRLVSLCEQKIREHDSEELGYRLSDCPPASVRIEALYDTRIAGPKKEVKFLASAPEKGRRFGIDTLCMGQQGAMAQSGYFIATGISIFDSGGKAPAGGGFVQLRSLSAELVCAPFAMLGQRLDIYPTLFSARECEILGAGPFALVVVREQEEATMAVLHGVSVRPPLRAIGSASLGGMRIVRLPPPPA